MISVKDASGNTITSDSNFAILNSIRYRGSDSNFAILNSIRYRGYYYDTESGLYYLQSRYYDPTTGRFVNADSIAYTTTDSFVGLNLFAYADNNFVNRFDSNGNITIPVPNLLPLVIGYVVTTFILINREAISKTIGSTISSVSNGLSNGLSSVAQSIWSSVQSFSKSKSKPNYKSFREVHHIVAKNACRAEPARKILIITLKNGVNSSLNLVSLKTVMHRRLHTNKYYDFVNSIITNAYNSAKGNKTKQYNNVVSALNILKGYLLSIDSVLPSF